MLQVVVMAVEVGIYLVLLEQRQQVRFELSRVSMLACTLDSLVTHHH